MLHHNTIKSTDCDNAMRSLLSTSQDSIYCPWSTFQNKTCANIFEESSEEKLHVLVVDVLYPLELQPTCNVKFHVEVDLSFQRNS